MINSPYSLTRLWIKIFFKPLKFILFGVIPAKVSGFVICRGRRFFHAGIAGAVDCGGTFWYNEFLEPVNFPGGPFDI
jgi:hypothetical protein